MIKTVANLLAAFIEREKKILSDAKVNHRVTIGDMYEDLSADALSRVLPTRQPLQVVSGFIIQADGSDSPEMDVMLVCGPVTPIPRTDKVRCRLEQVVAVLQSKKTLNKAMVLEGLDNLSAVKQITPTGGSVSKESVRQNFQSIANMPLPDDPKRLPPLQQMLYHQLVLAAAMPACIVLSYGGYKTHKGFRAGIIESLTERMATPGFGPLGLPDLVLNQNFTMVKLVGMPWAQPLQDNCWPLLATSEMRPTAHFFLESIYTKLVLRGFAEDDIFGEDLELDPVTLLASFELGAAKTGWLVHTYENAPLDIPHSAPGAWEPVFLSAEQHNFIAKLTQFDHLVIDDLAKDGIAEKDITYLSERGLVARHPESKTRYQLLTTSCICGILPDGRYFAGENRSGRVIRWVERFTRDWRAKHDASNEPGSKPVP